MFTLQSNSQHGVISFHGSQDPDVSGYVTHPVGRNQGQETCLFHRSSVRRLMPTECEALQGFPRDYTRIPGLTSWRDISPEEDIADLTASGLQVRRTKAGIWRVNDPDGPRYKALGNSMPVPIIRWICRRIEAELRRKDLVGGCPKWCPCTSLNAQVPYGSEWCRKIMERYRPAAEARQTEVSTS